MIDLVYSLTSLILFSKDIKIYSKYSWISDAGYNPSGSSSLSFKVGADVLNLLFLYKFFIFVNAKIW